MTTATVEGLTDARARELAREGKANAPVSGSGRTTARILRTTVFSFYNNTLFVIGFALLALGRYSDALVSVGLGIINAALAAFQELRAKRQLDRLQLLAREPVTVVRDGADRSVPPSEVVVGDLVRLRSGGQIVVDGPLVNGRLEADESLLTGESDPIAKAVGDPLLSGSSCSGGEGLQRAEGVGVDSHAGRLTIAAREDTTGLTPLQRRIDLVVRLLILLVLLMSGAILAQAALEGSTVLRFVQTSAVLSGLVPYGLFFLIAVAYAVGAARIGGRGALVQQTNAVEAISRVDVVCTDKTGTLTSGRLALVEVVPAGGDEAGARALLGTFARSAASTNATTTALAADTSLPGERADVLDEVEFRSSLRWSGITLADGTALVLGAPSTVRPALADAAVVSERRGPAGARARACACSCWRAGRARSTTPTDGPGCRACARSRSSRWPTSCATASPTSSPASPPRVSRSRSSPATTPTPSPPSPAARGSTRPRWPGRRSPGSRAPTPTPSTRPSTRTGSSGGSPRSRRSRSSRR